MKRTYAKSRYNDQKGAARKRGIAFNLTFEQWDQWFLNQGIDRNIPQGKDANCWCMCRFNDQGSYDLNNIYLDTNSNNVKLRNKLWWRNQKTLFTPYGQFKTIIDACYILSMTRRQISYRIKTKPKEYYFQ